MADLPPRRGPNLPEDAAHDLGPDAYEASVPTRLSGFRGTNPVAFVVGGAIAFGIVLLAFLAFLHRGGAPQQPRYALQTQNGPIQPVAPGIGGTPPTPFIPEASPVRNVPTPIPLFVVRTPVPLPQPPSTPVPEVAAAAPVAPQPIVPAPAGYGQADTGQMKLDEPASQSQGAENVPGGGEADRVVRYMPVYRDGKVVAVVPVMASQEAASTRSSTMSQQPAQSSGAPVAQASPPSDSAQFVSSTGGAGTGSSLGASNAGLEEARKFVQKNDNGDVGYVQPGSRHQLATATVINARLLTKIESDLPGPVIAQVTEPVYDSATHTVVVVPAGAKVFGTYDEETVSSSSRLLMAFTRLIFPDGEEFDIGGQPGSGADGTAGFSGDVDKHRGQLYTTALLLTVLAGAESAITPQQNASLLQGQSIGSQVQQAAGAELSQVGNKLVDQSVGRPATIIIRPPYAFQIIVTRDLPLDEYIAQHQ